MSHKRKWKDSFVALPIDNDDDCNAFNDMNDLDSENDSNAHEDYCDARAVVTTTGTGTGSIWLQEATSHLYTNITNCDNVDSACSDLVIDENVITKYFTSAIQSHYYPKLVMEPTTTGSSFPGKAVPNNKRNERGSKTSDDSCTLIKTWNPKEIELPLWAVVASQK